MINVGQSSHCLFSYKQRDFNVTSRTVIQMTVTWGQCKQTDMTVDYSLVRIQLGNRRFQLLAEARALNQ